MNIDNTVTPLQAANLVKGDLEGEIINIATDVAIRLDNDGTVASWALISKHFVLKGSQDSVGDWINGDDLFDQGFKDKPLSEMLEILAQSNYGGPNFAMKIARDGRIFINGEV